jgi:hypothetical protein
MEQTDENVPKGKIPEEPDRLQVAAEIQLSYPELSECHVPDSPAADNAVHPTPPPVHHVEPVEGPSKTCPQCGHVIPIADRFCWSCSQPFEVVYHGYCETCHGVVTANKNGVCSRCGGMVIDLRVQSRPGSPAQTISAGKSPTTHTPLPTMASSVSPSQPFAMPMPHSSIPSTFPSTAPLPLSTPGQYNRPGSYIDRRLRPGEQILYRTRLHWSQLVDVVIIFALAVSIFGFNDYLVTQPASLTDSWFFYCVAFLLMLLSLNYLVKFIVSELAITDQRLVGRYGTMKSRPVDIALADISVVIPRRFSIPNQGSIKLACIPRRYYVFQHIPRPKEFYQRMEAVLPVVRPQIARVNFWQVLLTILIVLLVIASGIFTLFYFTGGRELMMPVKTVTYSTITSQREQTPTPLAIEINGLSAFRNICDGLMAKQQKVYAFGKISLPEHMSQCSGTYCKVDFSKNSETVEVWIATTGSTNKMDELPNWYSSEDFKVYDSNGQLIDPNDLIKMTFRLRNMPTNFAGTEEGCSLVIDSIEEVSGN